MSNKLNLITSLETKLYMNPSFVKDWRDRIYKDFDDMRKAINIIEKDEMVTIPSKEACEKLVITAINNVMAQLVFTPDDLLIIHYTNERIGYFNTILQSYISENIDMFSDETGVHLQKLLANGELEFADVYGWRIVKHMMLIK